MKRIVQLSDLHFGRVDERLLAPLGEAVEDLRPDLVVISGDLTQRARHAQFRAARAFLDSIRFPRLVIPGNHDIPLYNVVERFSNPLRRYARYFGAKPAPFHVDGEIAVVGFNTTWRWSVQEGRVRASHLRKARTLFEGLPEGTLRIVVTHHPLTTPAAGDDGKSLTGAEAALHAFAMMGVDVFLSGHRHVAGLFDSTSIVPVEGYNALLVEAGTATSDRVRGEENAFNVLDCEGRSIRAAHWRWRPEEGRFLAAEEERYAHSATGWTRASATVLR